MRRSSNTMRRSRNIIPRPRLRITRRRRPRRIIADPLIHTIRSVAHVHSARRPLTMTSSGYR
jgi:hypothetical protein